MKKISVVVACYNEQDNVVPLVNTLEKIFAEQLSEYDYEILFMDNDSTDDTRKNIELVCSAKPKVKAIFNAKNFGSIRSSVYGLLQAEGDMIVKMCADFQDPPEMIVDFVKKWEEGYKIVLAIKEKSEENKLMFAIRTVYYKLIKKISEVEQIEHFTGYGLYDRDFIEIVRKLDDPMPYLRGIVSEMGYKYASISFVQPKRRSGKSKYNFYRLYDYAMLGITSYSKIPLRLAIFLGCIIAGISMLVGLVYFILKLIYWDKFSMGMAPVSIGIFFLGALQLIFMGILGEYILNINTRVLHRPLITEEKRINFENLETDTKDEGGDNGKKEI